MYSKYDLCDAVKALSMGFQKGKMDWFLKSIALIIGMTSESARNKEMRAFLKCVLNPEILAYDRPSSRLILMFLNWSKMSKFVRSADDKDELYLNGEYIFTKDQMRSVLSLLNRKDGSKAEKHGKHTTALAGKNNLFLYLNLPLLKSNFKS